MAFWDDFIVLVFPARATTVERRRRCPNWRCPPRRPAVSRNATRDDSVVVVMDGWMDASKSEASLYYDARRLCVVVAAVVVRGARQRSPRWSFASSARTRASRATVLVVDNVVVSVLWRGFGCQAARETSLAVRARRAG
jgi:hypothetical protein